MNRLFITLSVLLWTASSRAQERPTTLPASSRLGFESFRYLGGWPDATASQARANQASNLLHRLDGCPSRTVTPRESPDVEVQAFRLGSEYPELYSVWLKRGWVLPGSYEQLERLGLAGKPIRVLVVRSQPPR